MSIKDYIKDRPRKWGEMRTYIEDKGINKKINWAVLIIEGLFIIYAVNSLYGCPCAIRTCGIKQYQGDGVTMKWEAYNLDCDYVENYLSSIDDAYRNKENIVLHDELIEMLNTTWNETNTLLY